MASIFLPTVPMLRHREGNEVQSSWQNYSAPTALKCLSRPSHLNRSDCKTHKKLRRQRMGQLSVTKAGKAWFYQNLFSQRHHLKKTQDQKAIMTLGSVSQGVEGCSRDSPCLLEAARQPSYKASPSCQTQPTKPFNLAEQTLVIS